MLYAYDPKQKFPQRARTIPTQTLNILGRSLQYRCVVLRARTDVLLSGEGVSVHSVRVIETVS